jgi:hypothetical protein
MDAGTSGLYGAVDMTGQIIDYLVTEPRDEWAAERFLTNLSATIGSGDGRHRWAQGNAAAARGYNEAHGNEPPPGEVFRIIGNYYLIIEKNLTRDVSFALYIPTKGCIDIGHLAEVVLNEQRAVKYATFVCHFYPPNPVSRRNSASVERMLGLCRFR